MEGINAYQHLRPRDYGWFGPPETNSIPRYPGNTTALGIGVRPHQNISAAMSGKLAVNALAVLRLSLMVNAAEPSGQDRAKKYPMIFPGQDWVRASPDSQGVHPAKLRAAMEYLTRSLSEHDGAGTVFIVKHLAETVEIRAGRSGPFRSDKALRAHQSIHHRTVVGSGFALSETQLQHNIAS